MARSLPVENLLPQNVGSISTTSSNLLKWPNGELVAVDYNQLRTLATETVGPTDWSHPPPSWAVPLERLVHSIDRCSLSWDLLSNLQHARQPPCLCGHSIRVTQRAINNHTMYIIFFRIIAISTLKYLLPVTIIPIIDHYPLINSSKNVMHFNW